MHSGRSVCYLWESKGAHCAVPGRSRGGARALKAPSICIVGARWALGGGHRDDSRALSVCSMCAKGMHSWRSSLYLRALEVGVRFALLGRYGGDARVLKALAVGADDMHHGRHMEATGTVSGAHGTYHGRSRHALWALTTCCVGRSMCYLEALAYGTEQVARECSVASLPLGFSVGRPAAASVGTWN